MKLKVLNLSKTELKSIELPEQFYEPVRLDLIKRAVHVIQSNKKQPYGANPDAGKRASAKVSRRRHDYRGSYGKGISRVPRKILSRRGTQMNWVGAFAPGTVGGRRAHPPKAEKIITEQINIKERRKAIRSALSASLKKDLVEKRGHKVPEAYPFIIEDAFEEISTTKELCLILKKLGFEQELERVKVKTINAGKGKLRGRKYKTKTGPLFVISKDCNLKKAAKNLTGFDVEKIEKINVELLAPGTHPGRLTLYTESAITKLGKEKLFTKNYKKNQEIKEEEQIKEIKQEKESKAKTKKAPSTTKPKSKSTINAKK